MRVTRFPSNPIVVPESDPSLGENINGPSLVRAPPWLTRPLGRYYLYFAHHKGSFIRLAVADELAGPWRVHAPGALRLEDSRFPSEVSQIEAHSELVRRLIELGLEEPHIASPDVHVDAEARQLRMYFHGLCEDGGQRTRVAISEDGVRFSARPEILGLPYFRVFRHAGWHYALGMPGLLYRSRDGLEKFEPGPMLFGPDTRHMALLKRGDELLVFWTRVGDAPEHILCSRLALGPDWTAWRASEPVEVLRPEATWEGADLPPAPSVRGAALEPLNELRDPCILEEEGALYLLYSVAGESGIAIARLELDH
jgi:hypothetical protein